MSTYNIDVMTKEKFEEIIAYYNGLLTGLEESARQSERAYGGYLRAFKGELVEYIAKQLVELAWASILKQEKSRLKIDKKKIPVYLTDKYDYISHIENRDVRKFLYDNKENIAYKFGTDVQVYVDNQLVLPIECKAYTENAMLKRIIFDAELMREVKGCKKYFLLQLESQLGGDYSSLNDTTYGSPATHALLSHAETEIEIITLLKGERNVDKPIHKPEYFKELEYGQLVKAATIFAESLSPYIQTR